jgi:hypothetical protein
VVFHFEADGELTMLKVNFIKTDLDVALTFAQIASQTGDRDKAVRNQRNARKAYDTLVRYMDSASLDRSDLDAITRKLALLKSALLGLGERF